ncbi:MAG: hypothetical protein U9O82_07960 [Thermodesulfobacteriota bacterium]|nr:hypothetical protein [Thermodesulfobacteriota bacterium]
MLKKFFLTIFFLIFCFVPVYGSNNGAQATGGDNKETGITEETGQSPRLEVDSLHQDYGEVIKGEKIVHSFIIRNQGEGELIIKKAKPG